MIKLSALNKARMDARKRGADMTQALLYAAFAIIVLISVLGMYQVVTLNSNKTTATRTMSMASGEARTLYRNADDFTGLSSARLIQAGAVPTDAIDGGADGKIETEADNLVKLPYQGAVAFARAADPTEFNAVVTFEDDTRSSRALCTFLSSGETGVIITGPMGSEYSIGTPPDCANTTAPTFTVTYQR